MSVSVASQLTALLGGAALGVGVGLLYDGLGSVRRRISGPIRRSLLDLLFWLCTTAALFLERPRRWRSRAGERLRSPVSGRGRLFARPLPGLPECL